MSEVFVGISIHKPLAEYTDQELDEFLDNNMNVELQALAAICSEILRRQKNKKRKKQ